MPVSDHDRERLTKLIALSTSSNDAEALQALRKAHGMAAEAGLSLGEALTGRGQPIAVSESPRASPVPSRSVFLHMTPAQAAARDLSEQLLRQDRARPFLTPYDRSICERLATGEVLARGPHFARLAGLRVEALEKRRA